MNSMVRTVAIMVDVSNAELLRQAAERRAVQDGISIEVWRRTRVNGDPISNDLEMLCSPGPGEDGISIIDCSCN